MKLKKDETIVAHCDCCNKETIFKQTEEYNKDYYDMDRKVFYCSECFKIAKLEQYNNVLSVMVNGEEYQKIEKKYRIKDQGYYKLDTCKECGTVFPYGQILCEKCNTIIWENYTQFDHKYIFFTNTKYTFSLYHNEGYDRGDGKTQLVLDDYVIYEENEDCINYKEVNKKVKSTIKYIKNQELRIVEGGIIIKSNFDNDISVYSLKEF